MLKKTFLKYSPTLKKFIFQFQFRDVFYLIFPLNATIGHNKKTALTPWCHTKLPGVNNAAELDSKVSMIPGSLISSCQNTAEHDSAESMTLWTVESVRLYF